jgi:hypothetical protein
MVALSKIRVSTKLNPLDRDALERCLKAACARKGYGHQHVERLLKEEGWLEAAEQACFYQQFTALGLKIWQEPPCETHPHDIEAILARGDDGVGGRYFAALLAKQLIEADLSQFEPDPVRALEAKRRKTSE